MTKFHAPRVSLPAVTPASVSSRLRTAGLRPTRQRCSLAALLFGQGDRHISAEMLHEEAVKAGVRVSLATIYNTLHQFQQSGLLRELAIEGQRSYIDTNTSNHKIKGRMSPSPAPHNWRRSTTPRMLDVLIQQVSRSQLTMPTTTPGSR